MALYAVDLPLFTAGDRHYAIWFATILLIWDMSTRHRNVAARCKPTLVTLVCLEAIKL